MRDLVIWTMLFQSTPLMRGETDYSEGVKTEVSISIHSPHARGDGKRLILVDDSIVISIHSPHARGDNGLNSVLASSLISIHSPHARGDTATITISKGIKPFQSTPLMRGETASGRPCVALHRDFNPLPSCEGRQKINRRSANTGHFNPLPSCEGRPARSSAYSR